MKVFSRTIGLALLMLLLPLGVMAQDRFVKAVAQADFMLGAGSSFDFGGGVNLGKNDHRINAMVTINYGKYSVSETEDDNSYSSSDAMAMEVEYSRILVPVEVYYRLLDDDGSCFFGGVGAVYNLNMSGKLLPISGEATPILLTDGLNPHSIAARICAGMALGWKTNQQLGIKAFLDINVTSPLKKYSISDRLFEYVGPIEKAFNRTHLGLAAYYTF